MSKLTKIGNSMYGNKYAFDGVVPFNGINVSELKYGDVIKDNGGKGMSLYVNECCKCKGNYLAGTLIFAPEKCASCSKGGYYHS